MPRPDRRSDFGLPSSELALRTREFARRHLPGWLYGHCVRSYLFGRELASGNGLRPDHDYDDELVFAASLLHDIGVVPAGAGGQRFEVDGADAAARFLRGHGVAEERVVKVWDAVALHTSEGIAHRKSPEAAVTQLGVAADILGRDRDALPAGFADRVHAAFPRHDLGYTLAAAIVEQADGHPDKAGPLSFPGHLAALHAPHGTVPTWFDLVASAGWGDRPVYWDRVDDVATRPEQLGPLFERFLADGDVDRLVDLYEPDAAFAPRPGAVVRGHEAIRDALRAYVAEGVRVRLVRRRVEESSGLALMSHAASVSGPPGARTTETVTTELARRQPDGRWLYAIDDPFFGEAEHGGIEAAGRPRETDVVPGPGAKAAPSSEEAGTVPRRA
ncbi:nuclear transport factor 2 family protein [Nocardiopsis sp. YSL2]|uniref:nuclear transport factor 2 family protein n=1 Tax=Nocardiopsis sp. YSL2 TaxID=2939492 RepID=UPI0026F440F2|nr:nuclear transport factor 2 family protein [Nocardiopsis sp. YSL2]